MIYNLCNLYSDANFDTFHHVSIIEATQLPRFDHYTSNNQILQIINSLTQNHKVLHIPLMPEKINVKSNTKTSSNNKLWDNKINFPVTPQDQELKRLLDTYNNKLVIALVKKYNQMHLYGTSAQPLVFIYDDLHANTPAGLKGFSLNMEGETYGSAIYFNAQEIADNPIIQGLAFPLAGTL